MNEQPERNQGHDGAMPPPISFVPMSSLIAVLVRRWRLLFAGGAAGLVVAMVLSLVFPPVSSASATLLLGHPAGSNPPRAIQTQAELAKTRVVAVGAIERLRADMSPEELLPQYGVTPITDDLIRITATGASGREAVRRVDAIAREFLEFRQNETDRQARVAVETIERRIRALTAELAPVNEEIGAFVRSTDRSESAVRAFGELLSRQARINKDIDDLRRLISSTIRDAESVNARSVIVDPAAENLDSALMAFARNGMAGLLLGFGVTAMGVVVHALTSGRVRKREDVSRALGVPVVASVGRLRTSLRGQRRLFKEQLSAPRRDLAQMVRTVRHLADEKAGAQVSMAIVSVESEEFAALVVALLSADYCNDGRTVLAVDLSRRSALAHTLDVRPDEPTTLEIPGRPSSVTVVLPDVKDDERILDLQAAADVVLVLASADPATGAWHVRSWARRATAIVTAGRSTSRLLRSTAQLLHAAGVELYAALLFDADADDDSAGVLPTEGEWQDLPELSLVIRP
ncbi:MAG: hypothetical protein M3198_01595 [Actinomycetota bacterium]|nr:hypothetical protein [Actinomycetota bacterium]